MGTATEWERVQRAAAAIRRRLGDEPPPERGVVLGSGLASAVPLDREGLSLSYASIPGFPRTGVEGHPGRLLCGDVGPHPSFLLAGRAHLYEGYTFEEVVRPVRTLIALGVRTIILTNAAGGIRPSLKPGDILGIRDHLNLQGTGPTGPPEPRFGPPFIPMQGAYDPGLLRQAAAVARRHRISFRQGVYAGVRGPAYETPGEVRMLRTLGADAVGMSTVAEVIAARQMGARCLGFSLIANAGEVSHEEVLATGARHGANLGRLIALLP